MRFKYIERIKANISIAASKKTTNLLEGMYHSVYKGQSLDFDDLREYIIGDNYKDIDWKSSIRHGSLLVRRFVTFRKHNILFVIDMGEKMTGLTSQEEVKSEVALYVIGTLGYLVVKNGDEIGAIYAKNDQIVMERFKTGMSHLELMLSNIEKNMGVRNSKNLNELIETVLKRQERRTIMVVVSDLKGLDELDESVLKKVAMNHDLLFIGIDDMSMAVSDDKTGKKDKKHKNSREKYDLEAKKTIPRYIANNREFAKQEQQIRANILNSKMAILRRYKMSVGMVESRSKVPDRLIDLLERHNHEIRR